MLFMSMSSLTIVQGSRNEPAPTSERVPTGDALAVLLSGGARLHVLWRHVFNVSGQVPQEAERIPNGSHSIAVEFVCQGVFDLAASRNRLIECSVYIFHIKHQMDGAAPNSIGTECPDLRMLVREHDWRVTNLYFSVAYPAVGPRYTKKLCCAECFLIEVYGIGRALYDQVGRKSMISIRYWFDFLRHKIPP